MTTQTQHQFARHGNEALIAELTFTQYNRKKKQPIYPLENVLGMPQIARDKVYQFHLGLIDHKWLLGKTVEIEFFAKRFVLGSPHRAKLVCFRDSERFHLPKYLYEFASDVDILKFKSTGFQYLIPIKVDRLMDLGKHKYRFLIVVKCDGTVVAEFESVEFYTHSKQDLKASKHQTRQREREDDDLEATVEEIDVVSPPLAKRQKKEELVISSPPPPALQSEDLAVLVAQQLQQNNVQVLTPPTSSPLALLSPDSVHGFCAAIALAEDASNSFAAVSSAPCVREAPAALAQAHVADQQVNDDFTFLSDDGLFCDDNNDYNANGSTMNCDSIDFTLLDDNNLSTNDLF